MNAGPRAENGFRGDSSEGLHICGSGMTDRAILPESVI